MKGNMLRYIVLLTLLLATFSLSSAQQVSEFIESPILAEDVAAGNLPPIDERIPSNPRVLPVYDTIGQYGGTWRRAYTGIGDRFGPTKLIEERAIEFYMNEEQELSIELNWVDQFEPNENSSEYTIHIREGLRWSDGELVTTEDVRFWYEDILLNKEFFPTMPANLVINGEPAIVEIIDDYTFKFKFAAPYPLFPTLVAQSTPGAYALQGSSFVAPAHYLKDFHASYASDDTLNSLVAEYDVENWIDLWGSGPIQAWWRNPDLPVLGAWKIETPAPAAEMVMVRNPYYHAVDSAGNQLPYIDRVVHTLAESGDLIPAWATQGLIDLQARHLGSSLYDFLVRGEALGNYTVETWRGSSTRSIYLNLNTPNTALAELYSDIRFRQALSIGINRNELLFVVYNGLGEVRQASPVTGSPNFDPEFETKWTEFDPTTANSLLDEMGLTNRNDAGIRLYPDGTPITIIISASDSTTSGSNITLDLIQRYWAGIGIALEAESLERIDYETRAANGQMDAGSWWFDRNLVIGADPGRYLGTTTDGPWAPLYAKWMASNGADGVEPPAEHPIRGIWAAWENAKSASNLEEAEMFIQEMVNIHKENIWVIGLVGEIPSMYVVSNNIHNFPKIMIHDNATRDIGIAQPAQFFFDPIGQ